MSHVKLIEMNAKEIHKRWEKIYNMSFHLHKETLAYINELPELIDDLRLKVLLVQQAECARPIDRESYRQLLEACSESYDRLMYCFYILNILIGLPLLIPTRDVLEKMCLALSDPIWRYWSRYEDFMGDYLKSMNELARFPFIDFDKDEFFKDQIEKAIEIRDFIMKNEKKE